MFKRGARARVIPVVFGTFLFLCVACLPAVAQNARVYKVLPHYLNADGQHSLSPSFYERDAYQFYLRKNPEKRAGLRFDIHWKAKNARGKDLKLRMELRSSTTDPSKPIVLQTTVRPKRTLSSWTGLTLKDSEYKALGELIAWRATLWDDDKLLAEQRSFLW